MQSILMRAALVVALTASAASLSAPAAAKTGYRPPTSNVKRPGLPPLRYRLSCAYYETILPSGSISNQYMLITNTSRRTFRAGTRVYWWVSGRSRSPSFFKATAVLTKPLPPGGSSKIHTWTRMKGCGAEIIVRR